LAQLQSQSTNATAPAPASGVEKFQNIIKNAKLSKFHGDALVDKMSFATWITSHVKAVIGVTTDQHVQQLAHQYLSDSALSKSKATQRRPQADATPHERFTSWMAEMETNYPGTDSMDRLALFSSMRTTIATPTVQLWLIAARESLDSCQGMVSKVDQPDEYDILVVNKFVFGLPVVVQHTVRQFHKLTDDITTCASIEDVMDRAQTHFQSLSKFEMEAALSPDSIALPLASIRTQTCFTPFCAANTSHITSKCIFSRVRKALTDAIAKIDAKSREGVYDKPPVNIHPCRPRGNYSGGANQSKAYVRPYQTQTPGVYVPVTPRQRGLTTAVNLTQNERTEINALRQDKSQRTFGPGN
jgi:hypothetical protein